MSDKRGKESCLAALAVLDEPIEGDFDVHVVLGRDRVAADLTALNLLKAKDVDDLLSGSRSGEVILVSEDEEGDPSEGGLCEELLELLLGALELLLVGRVDDVDDGVDAAAVALPHAAETGLAADIPHLDSDVPLSDLLHVEPDGGDHVLLEGPGRDDVDKSGLARVLETNKSELHLLLPEEALDPIDERVKEVNNCCHFFFCFVSVSVFFK